MPTAMEYLFREQPCFRHALTPLPESLATSRPSSGRATTTALIIYLEPHMS